MKSWKRLIWNRTSSPFRPLVRAFIQRRKLQPLDRLSDVFVCFQMRTDLLILEARTFLSFKLAVITRTPARPKFLLRSTWPTPFHSKMSKFNRLAWRKVEILAKVGNVILTYLLLCQRRIDLLGIESLMCIFMRSLDEVTRFLACFYFFNWWLISFTLVIVILQIQVYANNSKYWQNKAESG